MNIMEMYRRFRTEVDLIGDYMIEQFKLELKAQGHTNTGALDASFYKQIHDVGNLIVMEILANGYGVIVDQGVTSARVPYGNKSKKTSAYIEGLMDYFKSKGLDESLAKKAAFATAKVHKREGIPTRKSLGVSNNGRRTNFVDATINTALPRIESLIATAAENVIEVYFNDMVNKYTILMNGN